MTTSRIKFVLCLVLAFGAAAVAGPLNPPAGPVTSTYKTLVEVEPRTAISAVNTPANPNASFVITQPGSYYLTGDITVPSGKSGIQVYAYGVTIDLNGFTIRGSSGSLNGITTNSVYWSDITVKNGAIENCGSNGIDFTTVWSAHVTGVAASQNGAAGVAIFDGVVDHCTAYLNAEGFASVTGFGSFMQCTATENTGSGFVSSGSSTFESCTSNGNGNRGFDVGQGSTVRNCQAENNAGQGIVCTYYSTITGNMVYANGGAGLAGIWLQNGENTAQDNDVTDNGYGIYVGGAGNIIIRNRVGVSNQANFYIVAGNHVGLIVTPTTTSTLINGSSGGGLGTTDPNANLVF